MKEIDRKAIRNKNMFHTLFRVYSDEHMKKIIDLFLPKYEQLYPRFVCLRFWYDVNLALLHN